jgi:hypothetical protein
VREENLDLVGLADPVEQQRRACAGHIRKLHPACRPPRPSREVTRRNTAAAKPPFASPLGTSASGLPLGAFTIRISELQRGYIDHAINLIIPFPRANCFSWPANRDDGNAAGSDIPCEGQRFRLNPSFDTNTLYSPAARTIARAMQKYGLILTDMGGAMVTMAEDPRPYEATHGGVNPYPALMDPDHLLPGNEWQYVLTQIPVDQLQALPFSYGEPAVSHLPAT